LLVICCHYFNA